MPNCRKAAEYLADAFLICDKLKTGWLATPDVGLEVEHPSLNIKYLELEVENLESNLEAFFKELERKPFEGAAHDLANLRLQAEHVEKGGQINQTFLYRYAEDLQKQIINQGILDIVDCQCKQV